MIVLIVLVCYMQTLYKIFTAHFHISRLPSDVFARLENAETLSGVPKRLPELPKSRDIPYCEILL